MAAGTSDPFDGIRWLFAHPQSVIWFIAVVAVWFRWVSRRARAAPFIDAPDGRRALLDGLRLAAAAKSAQAAQTRRFAGSAVPATRPGGPVPPPFPGPSAARAAIPAAISGAGQAAWPQGAPTAGDATRGLRQPARAPRRSPLLHAFRDPAGARTAVILAEILAKPVGLR